MQRFSGAAEMPQVRDRQEGAEQADFHSLKLS
jgi:hypothetical protein